jgi:hypothetical protein
MNLSQIANALDGGLLGNASGSGAILAAADAARDRSDRAVTIKPNPEVFRRHSTSIAASCVNRLTRETADTQQRGEDWLVRGSYADRTTRTVRRRPSAGGLQMKPSWTPSKWLTVQRGFTPSYGTNMKSGGAA